MAGKSRSMVLTTSSQVPLTLPQAPLAVQRSNQTVSIAVQQQSYALSKPTPGLAGKAPSFLLKRPVTPATANIVAPATTSRPALRAAVYSAGQVTNPLQRQRNLPASAIAVQAPFQSVSSVSRYQPVVAAKAVTPRTPAGAKRIRESDMVEASMVAEEERARADQAKKANEARMAVNSVAREKQDRIRELESKPSLREVEQCELNELRKELKQLLAAGPSSSEFPSIATQTAAFTTTGPPAASSVWVTVHIRDRMGMGSNSTFEIIPIPSNISALRDAVKAKMTPVLKDYAAAELHVWRSPVEPGCRPQGDESPLKPQTTLVGGHYYWVEAPAKPPAPGSDRRFDDLVNVVEKIADVVRLQSEFFRAEMEIRPPTHSVSSRQSFAPVLCPHYQTQSCQILSSIFPGAMQKPSWMLNDPRCANWTSAFPAVGAHIYDDRASEGARKIGFDVNDPRNGLLMVKDLEHRYDRGNFTLIPIRKEDDALVLSIHVASKCMDEQLHYWMPVNGRLQVNNNFPIVKSNGEPIVLRDLDEMQFTVKPAPFLRALYFKAVYLQKYCNADLPLVSTATVVSLCKDTRVSAWLCDIPTTKEEAEENPPY